MEEVREGGRSGGRKEGNKVEMCAESLLILLESATIGLVRGLNKKTDKETND